MPSPSSSFFKILPLLLRDALFLLCVGLSGMLLSEAILPGFLTSKIPFTFTLLPMVLVVFALAAFHHPKKNALPKTKRETFLSRALLTASSMVFVFSIIGSSFRYEHWEILILFLSGALITFLFLEEKPGRKHL